MTIPQINNKYNKSQLSLTGITYTYIADVHIRTALLTMIFNDL